MEIIIETESLTKEYNNIKVVNNVNIHVPKGKIYGLLGRNGAGKTTTMKMLLSLINPSSGVIRIFGEDYLKTKDEIYPRIGSIIDTPGFYENLTAYENLELLQNLRKRRKKEEVIEALEVVGLDKDIKKTFGNFSMGMKQRLGIANAIINKPELLILDEPINGLDPIGIAEIRTFFTHLVDMGTTILISSHILSEVEKLADIIGVMHKGQLLEEVKMVDRNRKYIEFKVSDADSALRLLKVTYHLNDCFKINSNTIQVYEGIERSGEINRAFVSNGIDVTRIELCEEKLEEYFSQLIGGGGIA